MSSLLSDSIRTSNNRSKYLRETGADMGSVNWLDAEDEVRKRQMQATQVQQQQTQQSDAAAQAQVPAPLGRPKMDDRGQVVSNPDGSTQMEANVGGVGGELAFTQKGRMLKQAEAAQATNPFYQSQIDKRKKRGISVQAQL